MTNSIRNRSEQGRSRGYEESSGPGASANRATRNRNRNASSIPRTRNINIRRNDTGRNIQGDGTDRDTE